MSTERNTTDAEIERRCAVPKPLDASDMEALCQKHFEPPHFAFLTQVRNGTGYQRRKTRTADALAMGTWPSRGIYLHGIEIKVSHGDFLSELKNPEKAEEIAQYCHYWWLAISRPNVAPLAEVPENWGVLIANEDGSKLSVAREAVRKQAKAPDHLLLAAIMRKVSEDFIRKDSLNEWKNETRRQLETTAEANAKAHRQNLIESYERIQRTLAIVEQAIGCRISEWSVGEFAKTYALAKALDKNGSSITAAIKRLLTLAKEFEGPLAEISAQLDPAASAIVNAQEGE